MQSLSWYANRLRGMSSAEIAWRLKSKARDSLDRYRIDMGLYPSLKEIVSHDGAIDASPGFSVSDVEPGAWASDGASKDEARWHKRLMQHADMIAGHRLSFFDLINHDLGDPIDWNRDHASGRKAPMCHAQSIDYRDFQVAGDCKLVWEPNRHHQLVVLGRAYRASGDTRYAAAVADQLDSWLKQCPFGIGMTWRSPMELSIRLINWVWAIDLIRESKLLTGELRARALHSVYLHLWDVTRKYSRGSSANNHIIGEAAGVFIATSYFNKLPNTERWREESREILEREIMEQSYPDGCTREQAFGYQFFVLQFYLFSLAAARAAGEDFSDEYLARLEKMLEFVGFLTEGGGEPPMFGDCDDGYVLDLGGSYRDPRWLLGIGAVLFGRSDFKAWSGGHSEPVRWLLGGSSFERFDTVATSSPRESMESRGFADSGYYLLQCGKRESADHISVFFDCSELGFKSIAAHGHADALSFTLRAFGYDLFVDTGTYDYFSFPEWRKYFRSTRAHNALVVDEADQSVMQGPFMWGARAEARCVRWEPRSDGGVVTGEHNGYTRLADPVTHRRTLELDGESRTLTIKDEILAKKAHDVAIYFHLSELCSPLEIGSNCYEIIVDGRRVTLEIDPSLSVYTLTGSEKPMGGWVSRGYHRKAPCTTIIAHGACKGNASFTSRVRVSAIE